MSKFDYDTEDMFDMPTPCQKCGEIFDLNDGITSKKWWPNTIICEKCGEEENEEIEQDEIFEEELSLLSDKMYDVRDILNNCIKRDYIHNLDKSDKKLMVSLLFKLIETVDVSWAKFLEEDEKPSIEKMAIKLYEIINLNK